MHASVLAETLPLFSQETHRRVQRVADGTAAEALRQVAMTDAFDEADELAFAPPDEPDQRGPRPSVRTANG
jgi:hypothetical protein